MLHYYSLAEGDSLATDKQQVVPIADEGGWPVFDMLGLDGAGLVAAFDALVRSLHVSFGCRLLKRYTR